MHVSFQHGTSNQVSRIQLLKIIRSQELVVLVKHCVLRLLHLLSQVLKESAPFGGASQRGQEISADFLLFLGDEK
jgi:hypothetical protein